MRQTTRLTAPIVGAAPDIGGLMASIASACLRRAAPIALACAALCVLGSCGPDERLVEIQHEHTLDEADFARVDRNLVERAWLDVSPMDDGRLILRINKLGSKIDQDIDFVVLDLADGSWTAFGIPWASKPNPSGPDTLVFSSFMRTPELLSIVARVDLDERTVRVVSPPLMGRDGPAWLQARISRDGERVLTARTDATRDRLFSSVWMLGADHEDAELLDDDFFDWQSLRWTHDEQGYFVVRHPELDPSTVNREDGFGHRYRLPALDYSTTYIDRHDIGRDRMVRVARLYTRFRMGEPSPCGRYIAGIGWDPKDESFESVGVVEIDSGELRWLEPAWRTAADAPRARGPDHYIPPYAWRADGERFLATAKVEYGSGHANEYFIGEYDAASGERIRMWEVTDDHTWPIYHPDGTIIIPRKGVGLETLNDAGSISVLWRLDSLFGGP